jgi:hypothetical protein
MSKQFIQFSYSEIGTLRDVDAMHRCVVVEMVGARWYNAGHGMRSADPPPPEVKGTLRDRDYDAGVNNPARVRES